MVGYFSGKLVLKECYKKNLPKWYFNLPKKGFEVPLKKWLRNDLKNLVEEATMPNVLETLEIRNKGIVTKWKEELFQNKKDNSWKLWTLISYYHWAKNSKVI
jgi:asparagine synthase (glutamine-hydrolysing)